MEQASPPDINGVIDELSSFLFEHGGTLAQLYGLEDQELEAVYSLGYNLYNQARWQDALQVFSFLVAHNHLERRFHIGQAACLQMLKRHEDALKAYGLAYVMDATDPVVALHVAECLIALGRKEDALTALDSVIAQSRDRDEFTELAGRAQALAGLLRN